MAGHSDRAGDSACLSVEHRRLVDDTLAGTPERVAELEGQGDRETVARILGLAQQLDVEALVERRRRAVRQRRVSGRPAPDTMMYLTALLPVREGVGVIAALTAAANSAIAAGDPRTRDQIMADLLVDRITGRACATGTCCPTGGTTTGHPDATFGTKPSTSTCTTETGDGETGPAGGTATATPGTGRAGGAAVTINVVIGDVALLGEDGEGDRAGYLHGYGPIPAEAVREMVFEPGSRLRRLYAHPVTGALVAMESVARLFPDGLAQFIRLRDQVCRTPWCDAPVRHLDHIVAYADGGPTTAGNGQGLCTACNHAKQAPGWRAEAIPNPGGRHRVRTTTPTGHAYTSTAPRPADAPPDCRLDAASPRGTPQLIATPSPAPGVHSLLLFR